MNILTPQNMEAMTNQQLVDCLPKAPELKKFYSSKHYTVEFPGAQPDFPVKFKLKLISRNQKRKSKPQIFLELNLAGCQDAIATLDRLKWLLYDKEFEKLSEAISLDLWKIEIFHAKNKSS